jgi:virulence-associated protein VapD
MSKFQKLYMRRQDARMNAVTECLNNIKMLKLYDWVDLFLEKINVKRVEE